MSGIFMITEEASLILAGRGFRGVLAVLEGVAGDDPHLRPALEHSKHTQIVSTRELAPAAQRRFVDALAETAVRLRTIADEDHPTWTEHLTIESWHTARLGAADDVEDLVRRARADLDQVT